MTEPDPLHQRHKPPRPLQRPRELILACCPLRSNVNLSRILRTAGCCGLQRVIACGRPKIDPEIARDAAHTIQLQLHRTLPPVLQKLKKEGYALVGLEQTTHSQDLHHFAFPRRTVLVIGNERQGIDEETLRLMDATIEIPVYGLPYSYNVAAATDMALYEFCRQYPD
jgi:tRNA G18 (ribose-2'-O)-methylase SpoU